MIDEKTDMNFKLKNLLICGVFGICGVVNNFTHAAFPDDFQSGVILVEETAKDGSARRAQGFNDGGIEGNVPGLREFLNNAAVDNTLVVQQGRVDATFGRELDFIHDQRGVWPNGPNNWWKGQVQSKPSWYVWTRRWNNLPKSNLNPYWAQKLRLKKMEDLINIW